MSDIWIITVFCQRSTTYWNSKKTGQLTETALSSVKRLVICFMYCSGAIDCKSVYTIFLKRKIYILTKTVQLMFLGILKSVVLGLRTQKVSKSPTGHTNVPKSLKRRTKSAQISKKTHKNYPNLEEVPKSLKRYPKSPNFEIGPT